MALTKHLEEAAERLKKAGVQIEEVRGQPATLESLRVWLEAVTEYSFALSALHDITTEAIQEKLDDLEAPRRQARPAVS